MNCPDEVAQAVLEIIQNAILSIRVAGWRPDGDYCALEANHIHNLPGLILKFSEHKLKYYLDVERNSYIDRLKEMSGNPEAFHPQWQRLERFLQPSVT
jgi:hypothetical protein